MDYMISYIMPGLFVCVSLVLLYTVTQLAKDRQELDQLRTTCRALTNELKKNDISK